MKVHILCLCLAMILLISGCGNGNIPTEAETETTVSDLVLTTTAHDILSQTTTATDSITDGENTVTTDGTVPTSTIVATSTAAESTATDATSPQPSAGGTSAVSSTSSAVSSTSSATQAASVTFKATVRDNIKRQPMSGITVTVFVDGSVSSAGSNITDHNGVACITLKKGSSYRVVLSNLPTGYEADSEYRFSTNTVNINIRKAAVQNELDHSQAQYGVGKMMTDFSLSDTDGNTYRLSDLLKEKQLIVLDFWYVSCEPCKIEFPFFEAAVQKHAEDMTLLAINPLDSINAIASLCDRLNTNPNTAITFPMLPDTCKLSLGFAVTAYPTTVFIDANGQILDIHVGSYATEADFLAAVERYLH